MKDVINLFCRNANDGMLIDFDKLLFSFDSHLIIISIKANNEEFELNEWYYENDMSGTLASELESDFLSKVHIKDLICTDYEYLGYRHDIETVSDAKSVSNKLYFSIKKILSINEQAIASYELTLNDGYNDGGGWCPGEPNFIYNIFIKEEFFSDLDFLEKLIKQNFHFPLETPLYYIPFIRAYKEIDDSYEISIVNTNTKARRLGYLKLLGNLLAKTPKIPTSKLNIRLESYVSVFGEKLMEYLNSKGVIKKSKTGISAKPYVTLANELGLLSAINLISIPSKSMKVYLELKPATTHNPFFMDNLDTLFFLEKVLLKDFFYMTTILELIYTKQANDYESLAKIFRQRIISTLGDFISRLRNTKEILIKKNHLKSIQERINQWREPMVYLEHVLMPRINWLVDLLLIEPDIESKLCLTDAGERLFQEINFWNDINYEKIIDPKRFIETFIIQLHYRVYNNSDEPNNSTDSEIFQLIEKYINEGFSYFKTLAPNRVTASQTITYVKYKLYLQHQIRINDAYIINYLNNIGADSFIYKYQKQYRDGYIQKNIKR